MADASRIEWTDATWNPIRARNLVTGKLGWHCTHVSEGCRNCYAEGFNRRLGTGLDFKPQLLSPPPGGPAAPAAGGATGARAEVFLAMLRAPLRWKKPRRIFVGSMSDLYGEFVTDAMLDRIFAVMALCPQHTFQVLTKRAARMRAYCSDPRAVRRIYEIVCDLVVYDQAANVVLIAPGIDPDAAPPASRLFLDRWPLPNVWLGVSAEDQAAADERIPELLATPAAVRFISAEPLLGPIDLTHIHEGFPEPLNKAVTHTWESALNGLRFDPWGEQDTTGHPRLDWVIVGGESGPHARPMHPDWARQIRDACAAARTAFFFKQWGEWLPSIEGDDGARTYCVADDGGDEDRLAGLGVRKLSRGFPDQDMWRVGKKAAGRLLDGVEHNAMPAVRG